MFELQFLKLIKQEPYTYKFLKIPKKIEEKVPLKGNIEIKLRDFIFNGTF